MSINLIKWLNFSEGCCIYVNEANGIPSEDVSILNGKYASDIFIPCPHTLNASEEITLTDKNNHAWNIKITLTAVRKLDIDIKIDNVSALTGSATVGNSTTDLTLCNGFYVLFGYDSVSRYSKIYLFDGYVVGFSTSYATGFFVDGSATRTGYDTKYPVPMTLADFLSAASDVITGKSYINILNNGYFDCDGISGTTRNLAVVSYGSVTFDAHVINILDDAPDVPPSDTDPYANGGYSGGGGGGGAFDLSSDGVDFPALPTLTAVSTGLVSVYTPNLTQLNSLSNFLWNANPTDVDFWKKLVANPLDLILGLSIVPVAVPAGASQSIKVGLVDTGVYMTKAASQFVEVLCGSIQIPEYWGSALDYSPFRRFSIYLPFIGTRTISTDDIMGKTVEVRYHVDLLSGACVAMVKCGDAVLYQYSGACAVSLPLSGETFTNVITSTIQLAASIGATVATGGAAAGVTAASAANSLMSMKPIVERAGGVSGAAGQLGVMTPYLIGEIPRQSVPEHANTFMGYPSNITAVIGDLTGYTEIDLIHISGIEATQAELDELEEILKGGFII